EGFGELVPGLFERGSLCLRRGLGFFRIREASAQILELGFCRLKLLPDFSLARLRAGGSRPGDQPRYCGAGGKGEEYKKPLHHVWITSFSARSCRSGVSFGTEHPPERIHFEPASRRATRTCSRSCSRVNSLKWISSRPPISTPL